MAVNSFSGLPAIPASYGFTAGKNKIINGDFGIWQRGTSISLAASAGTTYLADRWMTFTGANQACTVSRQATSDTTNLPFIQYALRYSRNSGQTGTGGLWFVQSFESANSIPFAGRTVTLSFYARKGANYSATSSLLDVYLVSGTGTDQNLISGYTGSNNVIASNATLTTTWQRFSFTATVPATATELSVQIVFNPTGTAGANDYYEITGVQLEASSTATAFQTATGTLAGELAACQRYYQRWGAQVTGGNPAMTPYGSAASTTNLVIFVPTRVPMRTTPSSLDYGGTLTIYDGVNTQTASSATLSNASADYVLLSFAGTGMTQYRPYAIYSGATNAYLGLNAEL